jgi:hypothetical protein
MWSSRHWLHVTGPLLSSQASAIVEFTVASQYDSSQL